MARDVAATPAWPLVGALALPGTLFLAWDLVHDQTLVTWSQVQQMLGFRMMHAHPALLVLSLLSVLVAHVFLIGLCAAIASRRLQLRQWRTSLRIATVALLVSVCALYVPYSMWRRLTIAVKGPGPYAAQALVFAAHDGDRSTVELLLHRGVSVDTLNGDSTALNGACAGRQTEMARFLLSQGADVTRAPDCQQMLAVLQK